MSCTELHGTEQNCTGLNEVKLNGLHYSLSPFSLLPLNNPPRTPHLEERVCVCGRCAQNLEDFQRLRSVQPQVRDCEGRQPSETPEKEL